MEPPCGRDYLLVSNECMYICMYVYLAYCVVVVVMIDCLFVGGCGMFVILRKELKKKQIRESGKSHTHIFSSAGRLREDLGNFCTVSIICLRK